MHDESSVGVGSSGIGSTRRGVGATDGGVPVQEIVGHAHSADGNADSSDYEGDADSGCDARDEDSVCGIATGTQNPNVSNPPFEFKIGLLIWGLLRL